MSNDILKKKLTKPSDKQAAKNEELRQAHSFYSIKHKNGEYQGLIIKKAKIVDKLKDYNFYRFDVDPETSRFVYIEDNKVREVSKEQITDRFVKYVEHLEPYTHYVSINGKDGFTEKKGIEIKASRIRETLFEKLSEYFSKQLLYRLVPDKPIEIKTDTKNEKFFYFNNGFVTVTDKGYKLHDYKDLNLNIWENQKLNRDFKKDTGKGDFERFVELVCHIKNVETKQYELDKRRYKSLKTLIGYTLHGFFDTKLRALILTDSRISDADEPNGRTGKTLFAKALGQMLNYDKFSQVYCEINGKDFNPKDKHRYSKASIETQLININDLTRNTTIESFFNDITEGVTVDKKNEKPFGILAKIIISTNKTIRIDGDSATDRVIQFEFSDYFNANRSPVSEFGGKWMFSQDWDKTEWNRFDTFMIGCVVDYLKYGIIEAPSINLHRRTLIDHTCHEFVDFMDDFIKTGQIKLKEASADLFDGNDIIKLEYGEKIDKKALYAAFIEQYPNDYSRLQQKTFTKWIRAYTKHTTDLMEISKSTKTEGRANGIDWIIINKAETPKTEENE